jgi:hypothetical protein
MTIRAKLYTAIAVAIIGLGLTAAAGISGMSRLSDRFDAVQRAADSRALALRLESGVTDFNGWQTAYGYDNGRSRPQFVASVARFRQTLALARRRLLRPREQRLLDEISNDLDRFMAVDRNAYAALKAGRTQEVRRIFLGPEITNFERTAAAARRLALLQEAYATTQERSFRSERTEALRLMIGASVIAAVLVAILVATALDLARSAERNLSEQEDEQQPVPSP